MIFFFNSNGNPIDLIPSSVYQGSDKVSEIYFVCPVANTSVVSAAFTLPDGSSVGGYILTLENEENTTGFFDENEVPVNVWKMDVPLALTKNDGEVAVQFTVSNAQGEVIKTATNTFRVERGVQISAPTDVETFQNVLTYLSEIYSSISTFGGGSGAGIDLEDEEAVEELKTALGVSNDYNGLENKPVINITATYDDKFDLDSLKNQNVCGLYRLKGEKGNFINLPPNIPFTPAIGCTFYLEVECVVNGEFVQAIDLGGYFATRKTLHAGLTWGDWQESNLSDFTPKSRKVAGVNLEDDITATELKTALSIDNVDNTSDLNKPVSTATQTALNGKQNVMQYSTLPTASQDNENQIIQYTGETDSTYTSGHFYKCVADTSEPVNYSWEKVDFGKEIAITTQNTNDIRSITIDGTTYNNLTYFCNNNGELHIGNSPYTNGYHSLTIGTANLNGLPVTGQTGISIGYNVVNNIKNSVCFDGKEHPVWGGGYINHTLQLKTLDNIFFRNEDPNTSATTFSAYTNGKTLKDYIGGEFTKVLQYTVLEADTDAVINMTQEANGTAFNYDGVFVEIEVPQNASAFNYQVKFSGASSNVIALFTTATNKGVLTNDDSKGSVRLNKRHNLWSGKGVSGEEDVAIDMQQNTSDLIASTNTNKIKEITVKSQNGTDTFPIGTVITVYGY